MLADRFAKAASQALRRGEWTAPVGYVRRVMPTFIESDGPQVPTESLCQIGQGASAILAQVIQVDGSGLVLAPFGSLRAVAPGSEVRLISAGDEVRVGDGMLGRVVDGLGMPIDSGAALNLPHQRPLYGQAILPLARSARDQVLETGTRAIDTLLPLGIGQRVGLFAGSGVGKSTLIASMAHTLQADQVVICLIGERGREAEALWSALPSQRRDITSMIIATADQPAAIRVRAAYLALTVAEYFRDQGSRVLLLFDSVTRFAMALREIGLAAGEPPTLRAYTPSVFAALPRLVERCGALKDSGSISAVLTVLTETDDAEDPLAEVMKSLLDGHIILSRELAEQGHFPAIDVPRSVSRLARNLLTPEQQRLCTMASTELALYATSKVLIESGLYVAGANPALDVALRHRDALLSFLQQAGGTSVSRERAFAALAQILEDAL